MKDKKTKIIVTVIGILVSLAALLFVMLLNHTALFCDIYETKAGFLTLEDYVLREADDVNEMVSGYPLKFFWKESSLFDNPYFREYQTSKGIMAGDSWEDFLKAYGNYYADSISAGDGDYGAEHDENYYDTHFIYRNMTPNEYDKNYLQAGLVDLSEEDSYIDIYFRIYVKGSRIAFSNGQESSMIDDTYDSFWPRSGVFNPKIQTYSLTFYFVNQNGKLTLQGMGMSKYSD